METKAPIREAVSALHRARDVIDTNGDNVQCRGVIVIERFYSLGEAEGARLELGFHGIDSYIEHENTATVVPHLMSGMKRGIELKVSEEDADRAAKILADLRERHLNAAGDPPFARYLIPSAFGAILGLLLSWPHYTGALIGLLITSLLVTIYNHGVNKGYAAGRLESDEPPADS